MKINQKQYNLLIKLLKNYDLQKEITLLTPFEASTIIEGILNNGKVKDSYKNHKLSDIDYKKRQSFFEGLVKPKNIFATEKQMQYIINLCRSSKYELENNKILSEDANAVIGLLRDGIESERALKYFKELSEEDFSQLVKLKKVDKDTKLDLPEDWILYDVEINGIIDF